MTHQSRDRGATGASPDVCLALPLSAERTHSQEPGVDHWKLFIWSTDRRTQSLSSGSVQNRNQGYGRGRMHMQRKVPRWAPLLTQSIKVIRNMKVCQRRVCMLWSFHNICAGRQSLLRKDRGRWNENKQVQQKRGSSQQYPACWTLKSRKEIARPFLAC